MPLTRLKDEYLEQNGVSSRGGRGRLGTLGVTMEFNYEAEFWVLHLHRPTRQEAAIADTAYRVTRRRFASRAIPSN